MKGKSIAHLEESIGECLLDFRQGKISQIGPKNLQSLTDKREIQ